MNKATPPFHDTDLDFALDLGQVISSLTQLSNWTERYRQLFKLANKLPPLAEEYRLEENMVEGCESPVWLIHFYCSDTNKHYFKADSDSKVVKGLLVIILAACNNQTRTTIETTDLEAILKRINFGKYLTPSRTNGLFSVMTRIEELSRGSH
ncbi:MAG: Fe-S metabolism protein SufE [Gammaproteobacteria bacterium]|nr:MAG: Fe-S metabolism protein SufE [Gammaproteobacteria bacterium]